MKGQILKEGKRGFTLVELIVVIAILAILAAVAYPVYTGYITKANEAADQVLLGAVNESFRSALIDEGVSDGKPDNAMASFVEGTKKIGGIQYLIQSSANDLTDTFMQYYKGNEDTEFKVIEELGYDKTSGCFYGVYSTKAGQKYMLSDGNSLTRGKTDVYGNTEWTWEKNGKTYTLQVNETDVQNFNNSSFGNSMTLDQLTNEVDNVVKSAASVFSGMEDMLPTLLTKQMKDYLESHNIKQGTPEYKEKVLNALVLQCAQQSKDWSIDEILTALKTNGRLTAPLPDYGGGDGMLSTTAATAAIKYGAVTAFANSEVGKTAEIDDPDDPGKKIKIYDYYRRTADNLSSASGGSDALDMIEVLHTELNKSSEYKEYLNNGEARKDLEGYFAAMSALNDNAEQFMESGVLESGYTDDALKEMLSALLAG